MRKEELFKGAIVLARKYAFSKRSRCKVIEVGRSHSIIQSQRGCNFVSGHEDLRPAKITSKSLKECGFEDPVFKNCKGKCFTYTGTRVHLLLKDSTCGNKVGNVLKVPWEHKQVRYMHEVQREVSKLRIKDYHK